MGFTPSLERGIFLTTENTEYGEVFVLGAALRNPNNEPVNLRNMDSKLFNPRLKERTFTEDGTVHRWSPNTMATQAVTHRSIKPNKTVVQKWTIPNARLAHQKAVETCSDLEMLGSEDVRGMMRERSPVDPSRVGVIQVEVGFPAPSDYFDTLTRQLDLRHNADRKLDDSIPSGDKDAIESSL